MFHTIHTIRIWKFSMVNAQILSWATVFFHNSIDIFDNKNWIVNCRAKSIIDNSRVFLGFKVLRFIRRCRFYLDCSPTKENKSLFACVYAYNEKAFFYRNDLRGAKITAGLSRTNCLIQSSTSIFCEYIHCRTKATKHETPTCVCITENKNIAEIERVLWTMMNDIWCRQGFLLGTYDINVNRFIFVWNLKRDIPI